MHMRGRTLKKSPSRSMLPTRRIIPWWLLVMLLWATVVWPVEETPEHKVVDSLEKQQVNDETWEETPSAEQTLLEQLNARLAEVEKRERGLQIREEQVAALQRDLEALVARQTKEAKRLENRASALDEEERRFLAQDPALDHLVKIYETMDPEEAALRIEKMEPGLALDILATIKGKKAAAVLAGVNPEMAAKLSEGLRKHREAKLQRQTALQKKINR